MGSGSGEFPYYMSLNGNFLLIMGSSLSWKTSGSTRGTFAINLDMQNLDDTCTALNLATATITWTDDMMGFPVYSVSTADVQVTNPTDSGGSNSVSTPSSTMVRICEFFVNALQDMPTLTTVGSASSNVLVGPVTITACMSLTYQLTLPGAVPLPPWATFTTLTRNFQATFPNVDATYTFELTVTSQYGAVVTTQFGTTISECTLSNCITCLSSSQCATCSSYAVLLPSKLC